MPQAKRVWGLAEPRVLLEDMDLLGQPRRELRLALSLRSAHWVIRRRGTGWHVSVSYQGFRGPQMYGRLFFPFPLKKKLESNIHDIRFTVLIHFKCTVQRHEVHLHCCATVASRYPSPDLFRHPHETLSP